MSGSRSCKAVQHVGVTTKGACERAGELDDVRKEAQHTRQLYVAKAHPAKNLVDCGLSAHGDVSTC